jgi:hypothetical protein
VRLLRAFPVIVLLTVIVGIVSYSVADGQVLLAAWAVPVAALGWWLTETPAGRPLPKPIVNILLLAALIRVTYEVLRAERVEISTVAEFVVFIEIIKLYDRKTARDYAQLLTLSIFLGLGSLMTSNELELGLTLLVFMPLVVGAVVLHQLFSGQERAGVASSSSAPVGASPPAQLAGAGRHARRHFTLTVAVSSIGTLVISAFVFIVIPRGVGADMLGSWGRASVGAVTGYADHVRLGESGLIETSESIVLDVELSDQVGNSVGGTGEVFYLRGAALDRYERGLWHHVEPDRRSRANDVPAGQRWALGRDAQSLDSGDLITQVVTIRDSQRRRAPLFTAWRPLSIRFTERAGLHIDNTTRTLRRSGEPGRVRYEVVSRLREAPPSDASWAGARAGRGEVGFEVPGVREEALRLCGMYDVEPEPALRDIEDERRVARAFERHLRSSYAYTLQMQAPPSGRDPIEWFLTEGEAAHCEYFASSMAGLCRSVGVNSRVVTGYVVAEYNETSAHYVVRESNAHAWVEVETAPGFWETFDPTPPSDLQEIHRARPGLLGRVRQVLDAIEYAWITSVVGFDESRRSDLLSTTPFNPRLIEERLLRLARDIDNLGPGVLKSALLRSIIAFALVASGGIALSYGIRFLGAWHRGRRRRRRIARADPELAACLAQATFYRELVALLRKRGLVRPGWKPPLAHARELSGTDPTLSSGAARLVELYYSIRYARRTLDPQELAEAGAVLDELRAGAR